MSNSSRGALSWCEVDDQALAENIQCFRSLVGSHVILSVAVKANAYGHGLVETSRTFLDNGVNWLCVHSIAEADTLRRAGISAPIYVVGPVGLDELEHASQLDVRMVVYTEETVRTLMQLGCPMRLHLKIETGNYRQGIDPDAALPLANLIESAPNLTLEGASSHFANIEDTTDHSYARRQLAIFDQTVEQLRSHGHSIPIRHLSNSAATILWPDQAFEMVRVGISAYGLWPSNETRIAAAMAGRDDIRLRPAIGLKAKIVQLKDVPEGAAIGYGCTYVTTQPSKIAVLSIGYFDGYDRKLSNLAYGLCWGKRAPVRGRVCMNMMMVDVTHIAKAQLGDVITLLGPDGAESISAEQLGSWSGTINYEVVSRLGAHLPRIRIQSAGAPDNRGRVYRPPS